MAEWTVKDIIIAILLTVYALLAAGLLGFSFATQFGAYMQRQYRLRETQAGTEKILSGCSVGIIIVLLLPAISLFTTLSNHGHTNVAFEIGGSAVVLFVLALLAGIISVFRSTRHGKGKAI